MSCEIFTGNSIQARENFFSVNVPADSNTGWQNRTEINKNHNLITVGGIREWHLYFNIVFVFTSIYTTEDIKRGFKLITILGHGAEQSDHIMHQI